MKESSRVKIEAIKTATSRIGEFLALSLREPVEYALDEISAKGFREGIKGAVVIPLISASSGLAAGIFSENVIWGVSVGTVTWLALGIGERWRWMLEHE